MRGFRNNIFSKVLAIILMILIPVVFMYTYSNRVSVDVLQDKIENAQFNQFDFFLSQMTAQIDEVAQNAMILSRDESINELSYSSLFDSTYHMIDSKNAIMSKLVLQATTMHWMDHLTVYAPGSRSAVSIDPAVTYESSELEDHLAMGWQYQKVGGSGRFVWYASAPYGGFQDLDQARIVVEAGFNEETLISYLDNYKQRGQGDPFLYHPNFGILANRTADMAKVEGIAERISEQESIPEQPHAIFHYDDDLVMTMKSDWMGWVVVDYVPLEQILLPIKDTNRYFYVSTGLLLVLSVVAAFLLYRHIRLPLKELVVNLQRLKRGDFTVRIRMKPRNEFQFVMERFNDMVAQIQELIEKVYLEKLRTKEAELKQMQSQINPHFLYNSLHFIKNMTILGDDKAVIAMSVNLGKYYRYVTRLENPMAPLHEEVELIQNYLNIQKLRMNRIDYEIDIPEAMLRFEVPRLMLQPAVENALIHGLEPRKSDGRLRIVGEMEPQVLRLMVEDNGGGMTDEQLASLQSSMDRPMTGEMGYGMWNVHQRLVYKFGSGSGVRFDRSTWGGVKITIQWNRGRSDVSAIDRG